MDVCWVLLFHYVSVAILATGFVNVGVGVLNHSCLDLFALLWWLTNQHHNWQRSFQQVWTLQLAIVFSSSSDHNHNACHEGNEEGYGEGGSSCSTKEGDEGHEEVRSCLGIAGRPIDERPAVTH